MRESLREVLQPAQDAPEAGHGDGSGEKGSGAELAKCIEPETRWERFAVGSARALFYGSLPLRVPLARSRLPLMAKAMANKATIVVPCYNEEKRLDRQEFLRFLDENSDVSFLFVNDGSRDATGAVIADLAVQRPDRIAAMELAKNSGKAEAVRQGVLRALDAGSAYVGYWDADLATPLEAIVPFLDTFRRKPELEVVFGSRIKLLGREIHRRAIRHYLGRVFATAASLTLGLGVYDTQCGAKIFRSTPRVRRAFAMPFVSRWIFDVELIDRIARDAGVRGDRDASRLFYELPLLAWRDVAGSQVKGRDFVRAAIELLQIRMNRGRVAAG